MTQLPFENYCLRQHVSNQSVLSIIETPLERTPLFTSLLHGDVDKVSALLGSGKYKVNCADSNGFTPLHYACILGNLDMVRVLVSEFKVDTAIQNRGGETALVIAVSSKHIQVAQTLLREYQCAVDVRDKHGRTVLHFACASGSVNLVHTLIREHKADINAQADQNITPLHLAALNGREKIVVSLINDFGCNRNVKDMVGRSILHYASVGGHVSLVQTLIREYEADVNARDDNNDTPLHMAASMGKEEVALSLINNFRGDPSVKGNGGRSLLHNACKGGSVILVQTLIQKFKADVNAHDDENSTPLHLAAFMGKEEIILSLINEFGCNCNVKGNGSMSILHYASVGGHVSLVQTLIREFKADFNARDDNNDTPLHMAVFMGKEEVALSLIIDFGCDPNVKGNGGRSLLHSACEGGSVSLVQTLIRKFKADVNPRDDQNNTPLHVAAFMGKEEVALSLINNFRGDPSMKGNGGRSLLHNACKGGSVILVKTLIHKFNADVNAHDDENNTPLHLAAYSGKSDLVLSLIKEFGCDPNARGHLDRPLISFACQSCSVSLVRTLILEYNADTNARDNFNYTPLNLSAYAGNVDVTLALLDEFGCDPNERGYLRRSLLHDACYGGSVNLVQTLIRKYKANIYARDYHTMTPLHLAAYCGKTNVALCLIKEFKCDINTRGHLGKSLLHDACEGGSLVLVQYLLPFISIFCVDNEGNTPLHTCSRFGHAACVEALLLKNAPILVRNNRGHTPRDVATGQALLVLQEFLISNREKRQIDYNYVLNLSEKKYSGEHPITRLFVIGDPGAGKSSLVESMKRDSFFESFWKISEQSVPAHTAGIVPSIHTSKSFGRIIFYDFAGDPEYYSSHAAVFENLAFSKVGRNFIVIVVDLKKTFFSKTLHYWFSFAQHQKFETKLSLILIGSHIDLLTNMYNQRKKRFHKFAQTKSSEEKIEQFLLDCRKPGSSEIVNFQKKISTLTSLSPKFKLSREASLLLGLFEEDFSHVTACPMQDVLSHIEDCGICLPKETEPLHHILSELHDIGVLLLLGAHTDINCHVILKSSKFTNEVHKLLFSQSALSSLNDKYKGAHGYSFNIGILPDSVLKEILPPYITRQCLTYLQYCQEITSADINAFPSLMKCDPTCQSFTFFPALCSVDKSSISSSPSSSNDLTYTCAWLAHCSGDFDYFPSRFLHVLLLRLVFQFTLSFPAEYQSQDASPDSSHFKRRCSMWKTGVHWLMTEGVECMVELVDGSKGVVVTAKSKQDTAENCVSVFNKIISCVKQAKTEFCHNISPHFFLLGSTDEADYLNKDNQFAMSDVERALQNPEQEWVLSVSGKGRMAERSRFSCMQTVTLWHCMFPIDFTSVLHYLKDVVRELEFLGLELGLPNRVIEALEKDYPNDVTRRGREMVKRWMSSTLNPCWWHLVQALKSKIVKRDAIADQIERSHSKLYFPPHYNVHLILFVLLISGSDIQLQEKLLSPQNRTLKPNKEFLTSFVDVVVTKCLWPSLAASLSLSESLQEEVGASRKDHALQVLSGWADREEATYGELCRALKTLTL